MPRSGHQWACPGNHKNDDDNEGDEDDYDDKGDENDEDDKTRTTRTTMTTRTTRTTRRLSFFYFQVGRRLALNISVTHTAFIMTNVITLLLIFLRMFGMCLVVIVGV